MFNNNSVRLMMALAVVLGVMILVSGCLSTGSEKSGNSSTNTNSENEASSETSPIPKIGQDLALYDFYNKVAVNQTKAEVQSSLGVTAEVDADGFYNYLDPSTGSSVNVFYNAGDLVTTKGLKPPNGGVDLVPLSNAAVTESQMASVEEGMTYDEVKNALGGEGIEMYTMIFPGSKDKVIYGLVWINTDFSMMAVNFDGDTGKVLSVQYKSAPV